MPLWNMVFLRLYQKFLIEQRLILVPDMTGIKETLLPFQQQYLEKSSGIKIAIRTSI